QNAGHDALNRFAKDHGSQPVGEPLAPHASRNSNNTMLQIPYAEANIIAWSTQPTPSRIIPS
ncbi:MAG: hypothetical protein AAFW66_06690, partial [Pseudomonadota bacterium]